MTLFVALSLSLVASASLGTIASVSDRHASLAEFLDPLLFADPLPPQAQDASRIRARFDELFGDLEPVADLPDDELRRVYESMYSATLMSVNAGLHATSDRLWIERLERVVAELGRRNVDIDEYRESMFQLAVRARDFDLAQRLTVDYGLRHDEPIGVSVPPRSSAAHARAWVPGIDGSFHLTEVHLNEPVLVVVTAHPRCSFSRAAASAISESEDLSKVFREVAVWVVPPGEEFNGEWFSAEEHRDWTSRIPHAQSVVAHRVEEWGAVNDMRVSPSFFVLSNGTLVGSVRGWLGEASARTLGQLIEQASTTPGNPTTRPAATDDQAAAH